MQQRDLVRSRGVLCPTEGGFGCGCVGLRGLLRSIDGRPVAVHVRSMHVFVPSLLKEFLLFHIEVPPNPPYI